jgi:hypothetical protein
MPNSTKGLKFFARAHEKSLRGDRKSRVTASARFTTTRSAF